MTSLRATGGLLLLLVSLLRRQASGTDGLERRTGVRTVAATGNSRRSSLLLDASLVDVSVFRVWQLRHDRRYRSPEELSERYRVFRDNADVVARHNRAFRDGRTMYSMSLDGPFADMTAAEFERTHLMESQNCSATSHRSSGSLEAFKRERDLVAEAWEEPLEVDWRTKGIITPVKYQNHCGSCWTFSTTGCLEAHTCLEHRRRRRRDAGQERLLRTADSSEAVAASEFFDCTSWTGLAEQQLVDCAEAYNNHGCNGGLPSQAFEYIHYNGGIDLEDAYPYEAKDNPRCRYSPTQKGARVAGVFNITSGDEDELVQAVHEIGPVSIAYQVSPDFRLYLHGVYDSFNATTNATMCQNTPQDVNHAVVAVGLGTTADGQDYYIVRNSWSKTWGMEGYFWMLRGQNLCGVSDCASFPIVPVDRVEHSSAVSGASVESYLRAGETAGSVAGVKTRM